MRILISVLLAAGLWAQGQRTAFEPGAVWPDTDGKPIQAHGGGILLHQGVYYWYGEDKTLGNFNRTGVAVYSSKDLLNWKREGLALPKDGVPELFRESGVCERPKVLYNKRTKKFVMWMHLDDQPYAVASAGVAVSDRAVGPFHFEGYSRPVKFDFGYPEKDRTNQKELGGTYRDMNLFLDDDGRAYAFYSSEDNWTMYVVRLNAEFTGPELPVVQGKTWQRIMVKDQREGPAPFKYKGKYYLFSSACTGWKPNRASYAVAENILGPWTVKGDPSVGPEAETTFRSQSTYVLPAPGKRKDAFIFMADRWNPEKLQDSRYVWLPFVVQPGDKIELKWADRWDWSVFSK
ncbi:glycoside hydrolase family 43 protein [Paludibaculum fermentans]|uniref:Family 43 glycosylhydrolase n=1 Tax=Paludibaculum fermentans TaxID=1473598 RepID=A0A7S7NPR5_PALFE|nr:glycoside hydrolase family 43 protein [Paludibaculum fermentans]QOY87508.1 family 43 glycosylhydrolase [Paludibaculum fermentans]